jgi:DNA-binding NarL/FixJ family response regulator
MSDADIGVWIDDPNAIFRRGLSASLDGTEFVAVGESCRFEPEPVLDRVDILVFALTGGALGRATDRTRDRAVRLVGMMTAPPAVTVAEAMRAGLWAIMDRAELTPDGLRGCLRAVTGGSRALPPHLLRELIDAPATRGVDPISLRRRELQILQLLAGGGGTREIAEQLSYSERTVKNLVHDVMVKLNCRTRAQAVAVATRQGII